MEFLYEWITNIILFVLLAIIIDLLLPNSNIQRYTKMVIGLLLIIIILNPILKVFNTDMENILSSIQLPGIQEKKEVENLIENKKKEIQASQRAYILEQMAVHMKSIVEEELMVNHGYQIDTVQLQFEEGEEELTQEHLQTVKVFINKVDTESQPESSIPVINEIKIDTSQPLTQIDLKSLTGVQELLSETWQIDREKVEVVMEGGKS
ncbi:stage III sporulation protein AF [Bacillus sp. Marseille-P3661]|uniref:stage III sporulation protein AF n=1 Tax=Bacillus sp. Marseille-P3661 TaxID=1936234 RepID=UPI000C81B372|nr:stage III sporulation protein AF [Bacillus sp. Marseille-P3661]